MGQPLLHGAYYGAIWGSHIKWDSLETIVGFYMANFPGPNIKSNCQVNTQKPFE